MTLPDETPDAMNPYRYEDEETQSPDPHTSAVDKPLTWRGKLLMFLIVLPLIFWMTARMANYKSDGDRDACEYRTSIIAKRLLAYHEEHQTLPPAFQTRKDDLPTHSWRVVILPSKYRYDESWDGPTNRTLPMPYNNENRGNLFHCTTDPSPVYETSYLAVIGSNTTFPGVTGLRLSDIPNTDVTVPPVDPEFANRPSHPVYSGGASNTILFVESHNTGIHWMEPRDMPFADAIKPVNSKNLPSISSLHPVAYTKTGAMAAFADGSVRWVSDGIDSKLLRSLIEVDSPDKPKVKWGRDR